MQSGSHNFAVLSGNAADVGGHAAAELGGQTSKERLPVKRGRPDDDIPRFRGLGNELTKPEATATGYGGLAERLKYAERPGYAKDLPRNCRTALAVVTSALTEANLPAVSESTKQWVRTILPQLQRKNQR